MRLKKALLVTTAALAGSLAVGGTAAAAFPDFSNCPRASSSTCINIQSTSGNMNIKGFNVPLGDSIAIRGGLQVASGNSFVPPAGSNGFYAKPVQVPGGLLGLDLPISFNEVTATAELAGPPSSIRVDINQGSLSMPIKLRLSNPFIGPNCHIGSNSSPVQLNLITGTTSPPAPNRPITGRVGTPINGGTYFGILGNVDVDNSFSIPGASSCGLGLGLIDLVIDAKLKLPSSGGNNSIAVGNDIAIQAA
jgi:hypothetical protein